MTNQIRWDLPVETSETPPRPVRVLATDFKAKGFPYLCAVDYGDHEAHALFSAEGWDTQRVMRLRNVPAKPVLLEAWISLYSDGRSPSKFFKTKEACENATLKTGRAECRRIVWHSDGSPVTSDAPDAPWKENSEYWKAKAEALQAEVAQEKRNVLTLVKTVARQEEAARSHAQWLDRTRPVVDAAVAGVDSFNRRGLLRLIEAVRAYQNQPCPTCEGGMIYLKRTQCPDCKGTGMKGEK